MRTGRLVAQGSLDDLRQAGGPRVRVETPDAALAIEVFAHLGVVADVADDGAVDGPLPDPAPVPEDMVAALVAADVRVRGFSVHASTLEERFVALTGEGFDVEQ
jgi:ABC-2 type transport system ATP-binding protein